MNQITMSKDVNLGQTNTINEHDIFLAVCTYQKSNPSERLSILRAFLQVINLHEYPDEFIQYQLNQLNDLSITSIIPSLFELLKQLVSTSQFIEAFNTIRRSIVESSINRFRKETQKSKWGSSGDKILSLANYLEQSLNLYDSNEEIIKTNASKWHSIVLDLFKPLIDELNDYLKGKLDKQQQQHALISHLSKPLGNLCEQLNRINEGKDFILINDCFSNIILTIVHQRIDFILNKKILDQYESFLALEEYKCPRRNAVFCIYTEVIKLVRFLDDAKVSQLSSTLIEKCNDEFKTLLDRAFQIIHNYPSSTSLEHCVCLISCLSSIDILFNHEQFQRFLYDFSQFILNYWQMNLLHDCDANDWLNSKPYFENTRYSVYIDTLFYQFNRLHKSIKQFCPSLLSIIIPHMLLELMNFIYHRYASVKVSFARQYQYKIDLLAVLVHASQFSHYFVNRRVATQQFLLFNYDNLESSFFEYGNRILVALTLVTCPCPVLYDQLQIIMKQSTKVSMSKLNWLYIVRPDWFEKNFEMRCQVRTFLAIENLIQTGQNHFPTQQIAKIIFEHSDLDSCRSDGIHLFMKSERWECIDVFVRHEHDWSFLHVDPPKLPEWLSTLMKYSKSFFAKCCSTCASDVEVAWRSKIQESFTLTQQYDEKSHYLKSLQQCLVNMPIGLYHLLSAINQQRPEYNKRYIFARLLYNYMIEHKITRALTYCSYLTDSDDQLYHNIDKLIDRKSLLFRFPHDQTKIQSLENILENLDANFERIRSHLDVKTLSEQYFSRQPNPRSLAQQQSLAPSTENLFVKAKSDENTFTDLNLRSSKRSLNNLTEEFRIDSLLMSSINLDWSTLFSQLIIRLKSNVIYHFITLRSEFQASSASSLNDRERITVEKLNQLLIKLYSEKQ